MVSDVLFQCLSQDTSSSGPSALSFSSKSQELSLATSPLTTTPRDPGSQSIYSHSLLYQVLACGTDSVQRLDGVTLWTWKATLFYLFITTSQLKAFPRQRYLYSTLSFLIFLVLCEGHDFIIPPLVLFYEIPFSGITSYFSGSPVCKAAIITLLKYTEF